MATPKKTGSELVVATEISAADLEDLIQQKGWSAPTTQSIPRLRFAAGTIIASDTGEEFTYSAKHPDEPAMTVRIVKPPEEYYGIFINERIASAFGRPDLANTFSKKWVRNDPDRQVWDSDKAYDALLEANLYDDYGNPLKGKWTADMYVQIVPENGEMTGNETPYVLTLSSTSVVEFKGSFTEKTKGYVSELNFIRKLAAFAVAKAKETKANPAATVSAALESLGAGGVIAEVRILKAENKSAGQTWSLLSFDPIHVEPVATAGPALEAGENGDDEEPAF
jgi:hypothetical protein